MELLQSFDVANHHLLLSKLTRVGTKVEEVNSFIYHL